MALQIGMKCALSVRGMYLSICAENSLDVDSFIGILFSPEDGSDVFLRNVGRITGLLGVVSEYGILGKKCSFQILG
jgi:hypothetical protein